MDNLPVLVQHFGLTVMRLTPLYLALGLSPLSRFPAMVRLVLLLVSGVALTLVQVIPLEIMSMGRWFVAMGGELLFGALLLLGFQLAFAAIQILARVLDMQIGFAAAGIVDPVSQNNDPVTGHILGFFLLVVFFISDSHHHLLLTINELFSLMPVGQWQGEFRFSSILAYFNTQILTSFLLLGPVIIGLWLVDIFNGVIAKTMPQMNVYFVMMPLKIGLGIFLLSASMQRVKPLIEQFYLDMNQWFALGWMR